MFSPYFYVCRTNKDISSLLYCNLCLLSFFLFSFTVTLIFLFLFFFLLSKTMGCFSGCLMSSASIQKWFCGIYSAFKCSFDEFVGEKGVSLSYSSAILGPTSSICFEITVFTFKSTHIHVQIEEEDKGWRFFTVLRGYVSLLSIHLWSENINQFQC